MTGVPLLPIDDACVAEARRALSAQGFDFASLDDAFVAHLLLVLRTLPLVIDEAPPGTSLGRFEVDGPVPRGTAAVSARAALDEKRECVEVRVADPLTLYDGDAPVLCRVRVLLAQAAPATGGVQIQRFALNRR